MADAPAAGGGSFFAKKLGPLPIWAWAGIALLGVYLYRKYSSGSSTTASTTASTGTTGATETLTTSGGTYTGPANGAPSSITNPPGTGATSPGNGGGTPGQTTSTTTTVPTNIANDVSIGGESYQQIGTLTGAGGQYFGSEVSGGAPVYFGSDASVAQLSGPSAIEAQPVGTNVYVPASDSADVSATQSANKF